jgi:hypothetical protein
MTLTNNQRYTPRWAELAEAPPEAELARSAQAVWVSPTETFLSTLIRCVKEQSENEVPPSEVISADSAAAEQFDESICAPQSARPSTRPHMCRWSFMRPAIDPSTVETASAIAVEQAPAAGIEEIAAAAAVPQQKTLLIPWTFMQPAIDPSTSENVSGTTFEETLAAKIEEAGFAAAPQEKQTRRWSFMRPAISSLTSLNLSAIAKQAAPAAKIEEVVVAATPQEESPVGSSALVSSASDPIVSENPSAIAIEGTPAAEIEEVAVAATPQEESPIGRSTLVSSAIDPFVSEKLPVITILEAPPEDVEEVAVVPVFQGTPASTTQMFLVPMQQIPPTYSTENSAGAAVISPASPAPTLREEAALHVQAAAAEPVAQTLSAAGVKAQLPLQLGPGLLSRALSWLNGKRRPGATTQLRVAETVSLGEKRFVAVVHVDGRKFLIGGGTSGVSLLTSLEASTDSLDLLQTAVSAGSQPQ